MDTIIVLGVVFVVMSFFVALLNFGCSEFGLTFVSVNSSPFCAGFIHISFGLSFTVVGYIFIVISGFLVASLNVGSVIRLCLEVSRVVVIVAIVLTNSVCGKSVVTIVTAVGIVVNTSSFAFNGTNLVVNVVDTGSVVAIELNVDKVQGLVMVALFKLNIFVENDRGFISLTPTVDIFVL